MEIIIQDKVYVTDDPYNVNTEIYIQHGNNCFPYSDWTDSTFIILEEWKNNLIKAKDSSHISFKCFFHDGPFWLDIYKNESMGLKVEFINDRARRKVDFTIWCGYYEFLRSICDAQKVFVKILYKNNIYEGAFSSLYQQSILSIAEIKNILVTQGDG